MSVDLNLVVFGGRLTADPKPAGQEGARFDLATNKPWRTKEGERREETTYMPIIVWGPQAQTVLEKCRKGHPVIVFGRLQNHSYTNKDNIEVRLVRIVASDVRFAFTVGRDDPTEAPSETSYNREALQTLLGEGST